jgi:hypothetical protein
MASNDECVSASASDLVIWHCDFFRHLASVIRHFFFSIALVAPVEIPPSTNNVCPVT